MIRSLLPLAGFLSIGGRAMGATPPSLRLAAFPSVVEDTRSAEARAAGAVGDGALPACQLVATGVSVCVVTVAEPARVLMEADLAALGTSRAAVFDAAKAGVVAAFQASPPEKMTVEGIEGQYWTHAGDLGFEAAAWLVPSVLGTDALVMAMPVDGLLLWWTPGNADFDKVLAVGVKRMVEAAEAPISAAIFAPDGEGWRVWGEVRGSVALPGAAPAR